VAPHPSIEGVGKPTNLIAFDMVLMTNAKVKDDVVYRAVKALHENKPELVATFPPFALFQPQNMGKPLQGVQFHPGAEKFFKEAGLLK